MLFRSDVTFAQRAIEKIFSKLVLDYQYSEKSTVAFGLVALLSEAGAFKADVFINDLKQVGAKKELLEQVGTFISIKKESIDANKLPFLNVVFSSDEHKLLLLAWLVRVTQRYFFARKENQERHEMMLPEWIAKSRNVSLTLRSLYVGLNFYENLLFPPWNYSAAAILGSGGITMGWRLEYALKYFKSGVGHCYLLTGYRPAHKTIDGQDNINAAGLFYNNKEKTDQITSYFKNEDEKNKFVEDQKKELTEAGLFVYLAFTKGLKGTLINATAPPGKNRPDTSDTIRLLISSHKAPEDQRLLVVSNHPYLSRQIIDITRTLKTVCKAESQDSKREKSNETSLAEWSSTTVIGCGPRWFSEDEFIKRFEGVSPRDYDLRMLEALGGLLFSGLEKALEALSINPNEANAIRARHGYDAQMKAAAPAASPTGQPNRAP